MGRTKLILVFGIICLNSVGLSKEKDNFFHHRDEEDNGFFSKDTPQNNLFEIFNQSQPVIFVNNPDLLKVHHPHDFGSEKTTISSSVSDATVPSKDALHLEESSATLGLYLRGVSNNELATPVLQSVLNQLPYVTFARNDTNTATEIANNIQLKLEKYGRLLTKIRTSVEELYFWSHSPPNLHFPPCCSLSPVQFKHDSNFGVSIKSSLSCDTTTSPFQEPNSHFPQSNLSLVFQQNLATTYGLRWQYALTISGQEIVHPAYLTPSRVCNPTKHGQVFLQTLHRESKHIVFVVDRSNQLSSHQFRLGLDTLLHMLSSLSTLDRVSIVLLSTTSEVVDVRPADSCVMGRLLHLSERIRTDLIKYLGKIRQEGSSADLEAGLVTAFNILANSDSRISDHAQIVIISGQSEDPTELEPMLSKLSYLRTKMKSSVSLSFVLLQNLGQRETPGIEIFHKLVASSGTSPSNVLAGKVHFVNTSSSLPLGLGDWYTASPISAIDQPLILPPKLDPISGSLIVSISQTALMMNKVVAVVGLDIALEELSEDISWRPREEGSRIFLIDNNGVTLAHPSLTNRESIANHVEIGLIETDLGFDSALHRIKSMPSGSFSVLNTTYTWQKVESSPYIVVVATRSDIGQMSARLGQVPHHSHTSFQYHGLILAGTSKLCRHLREVASMQTAALYLSPSAFASPSEHLVPDSMPQRTQSYMAYLTDPTRLIANPGLKVGVRNDAQVVAQITDMWKEQAYSSPLNNYIVRRRVATPRGVQLSYPGAPVPAGTDPTASSWYRAAVEMSGLLVVSPPRLDVGGAGYIVTLSQTVFDGPDGANKSIAAVVSADFTQGYFYKIVNDTIRGNICSTGNITCFLLDHHGYLVAHPDLNDRDPRQHSSSPFHLTHLEPLVATDLLSDTHEGFMTKNLCRRQRDQTLQRIFNLDLNQQGILQNVGEHCSQYHISQVPGTNLFLGVVNKTCSTATAFCWCSTVDRTCLDCSRMSQDECECPCECQDSTDQLCAASDQENLVPSCSPEPHPVRRARFSTVRVDQLPPCIHTDCQARQTEADCYGVLGCSWCHTAQDSVTPLAQPFCSYQEKCYSGILAHPSPYSLMYDQSQRSIESDSERPLFRASPIGPVAGGIMAFFLLLAITAWAYRHWSSGERRLLLNSGDQDTLRIDQLEEEPVEDISGPRSGHQNYGLHGPDMSGGITVVSPYRMNPGYRRPRPAPGTDSDHGYSTMTPYGDQDSEIMSCLGDGREVPSVNIQSRRERFRTRNPISLQSVTSGVSSRASSPVPQHMELSALPQEDCPNRGAVSNAGESEGEAGRSSGEENKTLMSDIGSVQGMTALPLGKHQMIVAATVHMVDT
eukprot:GFUD01027657.1.p1 GENE.GFUD01027657.1~~GFUD01027657.1.p1  ORF type:complete len:1354 (+),score=262.26 GFUD01027657.1:1877-5938(+)